MFGVVDSVLISVVFFGIDLSVQYFSELVGQCDEGGVGIEDDIGVFEISSVVIIGDGVKVYFLVGFMFEGNCDKFVFVCVFVDIVKGNFGFVFGICKFESKYGFINEFLFNYFVEGGYDFVY